jgi:hypothetical protein
VSISKPPLKQSQISARCTSQCLSPAPAAVQLRNQAIFLAPGALARSQAQCTDVLLAVQNNDDLKNCEHPSEWNRDAESYLFTPVDVIAISPLTKPQDQIHHEPSAEKAHRKPDYTYGHEKYCPEPVHRLLILLH